MKPQTLIYKVGSRWLLCLVCKQQTRIFTAQRLIDLLDTASLLQIHIDNADELPINQYYKAG